VKATGLAAGKGVSVCDDSSEAERAVRACIAEERFGPAGRQILIEERLYGPELSVFAVLDGERMAWFAPSRDHKRLADSDRGPNTGGMGAYTPVRDATPFLMERVEREILRPTLRELQRRAVEYRGLLYAGLILDERGPAVLEFNCRFGDPETQVVLPSHAGDLYELLRGAASGELPLEGLLRSGGAAVGIVLASAGYPASSERGVPIPGLAGIGEQDLVFHAATRRREGRWESNGGRVLCAVGRASDLGRARRRAEELADRLAFRGVQRRHDIAAQEEQA
jgi:phosphoribosylamine--glycine ligase